jgi:hypothetical protein
MRTKRNRSPGNNARQEKLSEVNIEMAKPRMAASARTPLQKPKQLLAAAKGCPPALRPPHISRSRKPRNQKSRAV